MQIEVSILIDRPVATVWDFYAVHHVENHPRWDPDVQLETTGDEPIGVGTVILRRTTRFDEPTEGTMEVVQFEPNRAMRVRTMDSEMQVNGWVLFEAIGEGQTRLTLGAELVGMDESMASRIRPLVETSAANIKRLIETEE